MIRYTLRQLEYLMACIDAGSLIAAAQRLNVSQPTVSAAIAKLETQLGQQLLIRHHAVGVVAAPGAKQFIEKARQLLTQADELQGTLNTGQIAGDINLGCFSTLAAMYLPGLITGLKQTYPNLHLNMFEGSQDTILDGLHQGTYHAALLYDHDLPPWVEAKPMIELPVHVVLNADHPLAAQDSVNIAQLADLPFIQLDIAPSRDFFPGLLAKVGITPNIAYQTSSLELARGLVGRALGYTLLVTRPASDITYDAQPIALRPLIGHHTNSHIVLCTSKGVRATPNVTAFGQVVGGYFGGLAT